MATRIRIDGSRLSLTDVERIADGAPCVLSASAVKLVRESRRVVEHAIAGGGQVYGVNTGFGHLSNVGIADKDLDALQRNLIRSHCAGVGDPLPQRTVRAILALRANCLVRGHSGLRVETVRRLLDYLNKGIHPVVPEKGSVGASGDLAPLAHIAVTLIGEGEVFLEGKRMPTARALKRVGLQPLALKAKEGLALINGTQVMSGIGILALLQARRLTIAADAIGAMTLEALLGSHRAFDKRLHDARPQKGQRESAANLRRLLRKSELVKTHIDCGKVQDCYSLRCIPQVHGAVRDGLDYVQQVLAIEVNSSTDNPMVFIDQDEMVSGGNFHGQPVSLALDHLGTSVCSLATISERRIERLLNPALSDLPAFLAKDPGLHSGFMMAHVTAAALVSENKVLAHPASVDTVPTSAGKEDHVSMGAHAARKAATIVEHVATVLAIEWQCAAQALHHRRPHRAGVGVEAARDCLRRIGVKLVKEDRALSGDIETARDALLSGELVKTLK
ncbi:MAG: histidine ammonia-lyase [Acidobacteriota bacterium]|nr:histidine ammonia-lyase [Acidobacteriota bacterium]